MKKERNKEGDVNEIRRKRKENCQVRTVLKKLFEKGGKKRQHG
jgi:hypothetical protein